MSGLHDASRHVAEFKHHRLRGSTHTTVLRDLALIEAAAQRMREMTVQDMRRQEFTWTEIGEALGISAATARQRWHRAK